MSTAASPFIVVTGASQGIGRASALELAGVHGCTVLAVSRKAEALKSLAAEPVGQGSVEVLALDLSTEDAGARIKEAVGSRQVDALVLNHGQLLNKPFAQITRADLQALYLANVFTAVEVVQTLQPRLSASSHIVAISSMGGFQGSSKYPGLSGYSSSKAALACLSQCLAAEFGPEGPKVNCLCLGAVDTVMLQGAFPGYRAPTSPTTMATHIARFALEGHRWYNGQVLPVALSNP